MSPFREELRCDIQSDDIDRIYKLAIKTVIKLIGDLKSEECDLLREMLYDREIKDLSRDSLEADSKHQNLIYQTAIDIIKSD